MVPEVAYASPMYSRAESAQVTRAELLQRNGRRLVVAGYVITILSVVAYCLACFSGGLSADMGDLLLENAVPFARGTLACLGLGTLIWIVGSFSYLRGAMESDGTEGTESTTAVE